MADKHVETLFFVCVMIAILVAGGFQIKGAFECADKGGAYIIPQNSWPVCVAGVK